MLVDKKTQNHITKLNNPVHGYLYMLYYLHKQNLGYAW